MTVAEYVGNLNERFKTGISREHSYRVERLHKKQINKEQYFGMDPGKAWNFHIGGYQPAEKWLKDRRDRELSFEEIQHYQKIIVALMETDRIMGEIDRIEIPIGSRFLPSELEYK